MWLAIRSAAPAPQSRLAFGYHFAALVRAACLSVLLASVLLLQSGCYSFKSTSIPPELKTFSVETFDNLATNNIPGQAENFTEELKNKIRNNSRLSLRQEAADAEFSGAITGYNIVPVAAQGNERTAFNRLEITIRVSYKDKISDERAWERSFTQFTEYDSQTDLTSVQDGLINIINQKLLDDVFNQAFSDW